MDEHDRNPPGGGTWDAWPACPRCRQPRQTICPVCHAAGTDFPLAEYQAVGAPLRSAADPTGEPPTGEPPALPNVLLLCTTCDEAFAPEFYPHCQRCGHAFVAESLATGKEGDEFSPRVILVMTGLLLLGWAFFVYFWLLLR